MISISDIAFGALRLHKGFGTFAVPAATNSFRAFFIFHPWQNW
jgi:hypothetical protein